MNYFYRWIAGWLGIISHMVVVLSLGFIWTNWEFKFRVYQALKELEVERKKLNK